MSRYDLTREQVTELLGDQPAYRVDQVWRGLYVDHAEPSDITTLPAAW